jgi:hypothetical protein
MALNSTLNANGILNRVAAEVGIAPVSDPLASQDPIFIQLKYLLNTAGEELMEAFPWELLNRSHRILTADGDSGSYDLPSDYGYMVNQTNWEQSKRVPMGSLSSQEWSTLKGLNLATNSVYPNFRVAQGKYNIIPNNPVPAGLDINFQYITANWVWDGQTVNPVYKSEVTLPTDVPLFNKTLISRAVKVKYLEAGGFDTTKAQGDYNQIFAFLTGTDTPASVLDAGGGNRGVPLLSGNNAPISGFGL